MHTSHKLGECGVNLFRPSAAGLYSSVFLLRLGCVCACMGKEVAGAVRKEDRTVHRRLAHTHRQREREGERRERVRGERQWGRRQKGSGVVVAAGRGREREPGRETRPMYEYTWPYRPTLTPQRSFAYIIVYLIPAAVLARSLYSRRRGAARRPPPAWEPLQLERASCSHDIMQAVYILYIRTGIQLSLVRPFSMAVSVRVSLPPRSFLAEYRTPCTVTYICTCVFAPYNRKQEGMTISNPGYLRWALV